MLTPAMFDSRVERTLCPPWGLQGGQAALPNGVYVVRKNGAIERFPTGKINPLRLDEGDGYAVGTGGAAASATRSSGQPSRYCGTSPQGRSRLRLPDATTAS